MEQILNRKAFFEEKQNASAEGLAVGFGKVLSTLGEMGALWRKEGKTLESIYSAMKSITSFSANEFDANDKEWEKWDRQKLEVWREDVQIRAAKFVRSKLLGEISEVLKNCGIELV